MKQNNHKYICLYSNSIEKAMMEKYLRELFDAVEINDSQPAVTCSNLTMETPK